MNHKITNAIVLMTALVPTVGHKFLIDFAKKLISLDGKVHVILGTMDKEPVANTERLYAMLDAYNYRDDVVFHILHRDVPQGPDEHPDFWNVWRDIVREFVDVQPDDYFVASELYGMDMARVLGCKFMPCNRYREVLPISGTEVREDLMKNFEYILPEFQRHIRKTITIFGPESCGKTTMAKALAKELNGWFIPEWAREYLETVGPEITDESMLSIVHGQSALQITAMKDLKNKPFVFQDTDLFSTLGYYRLWKGGTPEDVSLCEWNAEALKSDFYIVMNDGIPFEADPIRYGGDKRESGMKFWIDILEEYKLPYYVAKNIEPKAQTEDVSRVVVDFFNDQHKHIREYKR
jgi:HTH-type transcriptional regulator, transcriptional repressor of NAD biosynthesis genes